jgi:hypothetical protein
MLTGWPTEPIFRIASVPDSAPGYVIDPVIAPPGIHVVHGQILTR